MDRAGGFLVVFLIAIGSYGLSLVNPIFDPLVVAIIIGIFVSNLLEGKKWIHDGASLCIKIFLPLGIATYGFQLKIQHSIGLTDFLFAAIVFSSIFTLTFLISRLVGIKNTVSVLLATGASICGASAIIVTSTAIGAKDHDTSASVLSIMTMGLLLTIFYLTIQELYVMSQSTLSLLFGSTLPMLGLVKVMASQLDKEYFDRALQIKYLRIFTLIFMVAVSMGIMKIKEKKINIPWFMLFFFFFAILNNLLNLPAQLFLVLSKFSAICLTVTLSAIGLNTSIDSVSELGFKIFLVPIFVIFIVVLTSIFML